MVLLVLVRQVVLELETLVRFPECYRLGDLSGRLDSPESEVGVDLV